MAIEADSKCKEREILELRQSDTAWLFFVAQHILVQCSRAMYILRLASLILLVLMCLGGYAQHISPDSIVICAGATQSFVPATSRSLGKTVKWEWNFGDSNRYEKNTSSLASPSHRFVHPGNYDVHLAMTNDAQERDTVVMHVKVLPLPAAPIQLVGDTVCVGKRALLKAQADKHLAIHWFASKNIPQSLHKGEEFHSPPISSESIFFAAHYDKNGCLSPRVPVQVSVFSKENTQIEASPKSSLQWPKSEVRLSVKTLTKLEKIDWQFGDGDTADFFSPVHIYKKPGVYDILATVKSELGCTVKLATRVKITLPPPIFLPPAFSPNKDGINDYFKAEAYTLDSCTVRIYNMLGEAVYIADTPAFSWDGRGLNGVPVDEGVYIFQIRGIDQRKKSFFQEGTVTLVR